MKLIPSLPIIGAMLAALAAIGGVALVAWNTIQDGQSTGTKGPNAIARPAMTIGGPFQLVDHTGKKVSDADYRGRFILIFFGYAYCPDVCPTELATMAAALDLLGDRAKKIQPLFITVDPARDTPEFLASYVANFHPRLIGLTGSADQVAAAAKAYRVFYAKSEQPGSTEYLMDHSAFVYLMGPDGGFRAVFRRATSPQAMADAIAGFLD
jgi:cytochrome oxidase Cu insertion factor (SCO1/SenC/PrrC family)